LGASSVVTYLIPDALSDFAGAGFDSVFFVSVVLVCARAAAEKPRMIARPIHRSRAVLIFSSFRIEVLVAGESLEAFYRPAGVTVHARRRPLIRR
jgi:hypothetical protein